ncbi:hypothetical protein Nepgr_005798 [Nepenthes gracilis]|uniref:CAP-Gly domain-containing protein n=1 Tax=Nepenthes gracilis TaxID=150966 RepID=A0AAD3XGQ6_NEPGR|nr:hypothetical protein Nepgr_005798 [Nepenthes gracilis]
MLCSKCETPRDSPQSKPMFKIGQRIHWAADCRRSGTVKYVGPVEGYSGEWVGVDWDNGDGKHDGSINGVRYFQAMCQNSASFVRPHNLSPGITLLEALVLRYRGQTTKEEEDEMYVLSERSEKVSIQFVGKDKIESKLSRFDELIGASLAYLGVSSPGSLGEINTIAPNLKELDLTGNLLSDWKDVGAICQELPALAALNLSNNMMIHDVTCLRPLRNIRVLVLNYTGIKWIQMELLKHSLPDLEELHLMGNKIGEITPISSAVVRGLDSLRLLNLEDNCISEWGEILKLCELKSLERLHLNKNSLNRIFYPCNDLTNETLDGKPFRNLDCLLLGANSIEDLESVNSLNSFPRLTDIRLTENPVADPGRGGIPRFVLIARLAKVEVLNGSEVSPRERKESEIRYVRLVMSKVHANPEEVNQCHPRFFELKSLHDIEDIRPSKGAIGPQKLASGLLSVTLKCVGASMGEKPPLIKKLPANTSVGKLKILCESFFKLKPTKLRLFIQEEASPLPILLDNEMASLLDLGIGNESTILVDEQS